MTGWLIYDEVGKKRNAWFIQSLMEKAQERGISLFLKIHPDNNILSGDTLPDFAIIRTICPSLHQFFEAHHIPTFNGKLCASVANDKWRTYEMCQELGIFQMATECLSPAPTIPFPLVVKKVDGHGGTEVYLMPDEETYLPFAHTHDRNHYIAQAFCSHPGRDMRVYVMGENILAGILRESHTDFRSNFSLGGEVSVAEVTPAQRDIVEKIRHYLCFDFVGIDFIYHQNEWVLNEVEDIVGCRMLYACTDLDVTGLYMDYIKAKLLK